MARSGTFSVPLWSSFNTLKYSGRIASREWRPQQSSFGIIGTRPGCGQGRNEIAAVPFDPSGKLQSEQDRPHLPRRRLRRAGKFVNRNRHWPQKRDKAPLNVFPAFPRPPGGLFLGRFCQVYAALRRRCAILRIGWRRPKKRGAHSGKIELVPQRLIPPACETGLENPLTGCSREKFCSASASMTSSALVQNVAPSRKSSLAPSARGSSGEPGTAKISRPSSAANFAVMREPDRRAASTTTTARQRPATIRLRRGKSRPRASQPKGLSLIAAPCSRIC